MNSVRNLEGRARIPVLTGCTACGKTAVLLRLREKHEMEVISADSRQVYRGLDIGTAKPTPHEQSILPHHLIDCVNPDEVFSAGTFVREALRLIPEVRRRNSVPVIAGGTALYLIALTGGLDPMPEQCRDLRDGFKVLEQENPGMLFRMLEELDPVTASVTGSGDVRRQVRALELYALTGILPSKLRKGGNPEIAESFRIIGITVPKEEHRRRINTRVEEMIELGLIGEVESLMQSGYGRDSILGRTIGYREVMDFLEGIEPSLESTVESISLNTWHLARRQKNMFGRLKGITWVENDHELIDKLLFGKGGS
jgi:tRNA dimethylallyltransferase